MSKIKYELSKTFKRNKRILQLPKIKGICEGAPNTLDTYEIKIQIRIADIKFSQIVYLNQLNLKQVLILILKFGMNK